MCLFLNAITLRRTAFELRLRFYPRALVLNELVFYTLLLKYKVNGITLPTPALQNAVNLVFGCDMGAC